jgi:hypothetical protein
VCGGAFALLVLVMLCALSGAAIGRGALPAEQFTLRLGSVALLTTVTDDATCWRPIYGSAGPLCSTGSLYHPNWYYIGWLELRTSLAQRQRPSYHKLFVIHLADR